MPPTFLLIWCTFFVDHLKTCWHAQKLFYRRKSASELSSHYLDTYLCRFGSVLPPFYLDHRGDGTVERVPIPPTGPDPHDPKLRGVEVCFMGRLCGSLCVLCRLFPIYPLFTIHACLVLSCLVIPCHAMPSVILPCLALSCLILFFVRAQDDELVHVFTRNHSAQFTALVLPSIDTRPSLRSFA